MHPHSKAAAGLLGTPSAHSSPPQILALNTQDLGFFGCLSLWKPLLPALVQAEPVSLLLPAQMLQGDAGGGGSAGPSHHGISGVSP